jgi:hypothetical protein
MKGYACVPFSCALFLILTTFYYRPQNVLLGTMIRCCEVKSSSVEREPIYCTMFSVFLITTVVVCDIMLRIWFKIDGDFEGLILDPSQDLARLKFPDELIIYNNYCRY